MAANDSLVSDALLFMVIAWWVQRSVFTFLYNPSLTFIASGFCR
jgi:hypothetical protein